MSRTLDHWTGRKSVNGEPQGFGPEIRAVIETENERPVIELEFSQEPNERESEEPYLSPVAHSSLPSGANPKDSLDPSPSFQRRFRRSIVPQNCGLVPAHYVCRGPDYEVEECEEEDLSGCSGECYAHLLLVPFSFRK